MTLSLSKNLQNLTVLMEMYQLNVKFKQAIS